MGNRALVSPRFPCLHDDLELPAELPPEVVRFEEAVAPLAVHGRRVLRAVGGAKGILIGRGGGEKSRKDVTRYFN